MSEYRLIYWPDIPGRGELVRLVLEDVGADYEDVARGPEGVAAVRSLMWGAGEGFPIFAPPVLEHAGRRIAQTASICRYVAERHGLAPIHEADRALASAAMESVCDLLLETHDTHHPIAASLYYEDQNEAALARSRIFANERLPKWLGFFEKSLAHHGPGLVGEWSYPDLGLWQVLEGLEYAFPRSLARAMVNKPRLGELRTSVRERPRIAAYLASDRRLPFAQRGIFRRYPELDG